MIRCHIFPVTNRKVNLPWLPENLSVLSVAPMEIFASKIVALINRTAPRDLYDIHNLLRLGLFDESEQGMLRKCVVFYSCIGSEKVHNKFTFESLDKMPQNKIKTDLLPVLRFGAYFDLKPAREKVINYLQNLLNLSQQEQEFINQFGKGHFMPELLFAGDILENVKEHPMARWKCEKNKEKLF